MRLLPLGHNEISWQNFESFCLGVVRAMADVKRADKYGQQGETQKDIDIEAELVDGRTRSVQCRQRQSFPLHSLDKTVRQNTYGANENEIWISCGMSTAVSDAVAKRANWLVRDQEGISQLVRELRRERAQRVVDDHFGPHVRRAFIGPAGRVGFASPDDYFAELDEAGRALRHDLDLVGRDEELAALLGAIASKRVVVVPGRGGIGKTRLLRAAAADLERDGQRLLFALDGVQLDADLVDLLPREPHVVFVDDAHGRLSDVAVLLAATRSQQPGPNLVLAVRPGALASIDREFARVQIEPQEFEILGSLDALDSEAVAALAAQALGRDDEASRRLAEATSDLPLITVLGGRLLGTAELAGDAAALDAELRDRVMARFAEERLGRVTDRVAREQAKELATIVAALAPMDGESGALVNTIAEHISAPASRVRSWLGDLQVAGVLLARGRLRRVVPEILGEQLLEDACFDAQGQPTGYAEELWNRYRALSAQPLLANIAALEWRVAGADGRLLAPVWARITRAFRAGDAWERKQLLDTVRDAAIHQPERALELCRLAIREPSRPSDIGLGHQVDDADVREELPGLLRGVSAHLAHATEAMELLWTLGRGDGRPPHAHPDHPLRVLEELGDYRPGSRGQHEQLLALIERRLGAGDADEHHRSPLQLLDPVLKCEGTTVRSVGHAFQWGSYRVPPEAVAALRDRVRELLVREALGPSERRRPLAANILGGALRPSIGYFGQSVPREVHDAWEADEHATLDAIEQVAARSDDPHVRHELSAALEWLAEDGGPWPRVSERAAQILATLRDHDAELVSAISNPWDILDVDAQREWLGAVADRLMTQHDDGASLIAKLNAIYSRLAIPGAPSDRAEPGPLVAALAQRSPECTREAWDWIREHPDAPVAAVGEVLLHEMRRAGATDVREVCEAAASTGHPTMRRVVSGFLAGGSWFAEPEGWEEAALARQLSDPDPLAQRAASIAVLRVGKLAPELVVRLTLGAPELHPNAAEMLFAALRHVDLSATEDSQIDGLVDRIVEVAELDYAARGVLVRLGESRPDRVIDVFMARLRRQADDQSGCHDAVPYHESDGDLLGDADGDERERLLRRLSAEGAGLPDAVHRELGKLYWSLTVTGVGHDDIDDAVLAAQAPNIDVGLAVLRATVAPRNAPAELLEDIFSEMPWQLGLANLDFIARMLGEIEARSLQTAEGFARAVFAAVVYGGIHGRTMGEESARVRHTRESANAARQSADPASCAWKLFSDMVTWADREAAEDRREDDEGEWR